MPFGTFPLAGESFWIFIVIGCLVAALFGILLGIPVLRVKGDYLAIVTLGFGEIIRIIFNNLDRPVNITNGAMGIPSVTPPRLFGIDFLYPSQFYFIVLVILFFTIFTVRRFEHSKIGRSWKAVKENEIAAQAMGVPVSTDKIDGVCNWCFFFRNDGCCLRCKASICRSNKLYTSGVVYDFSHGSFRRNGKRSGSYSWCWPYDDFESPSIG